MLGQSPRILRCFRVAPLLAATLLFFSAFGGSCFPPGGERFLWVETPVSGDVVPPRGIDVLVLFASHGRVAPETFRCTLNGVEVTQLLTTGENGAAGHLYGLLDGENVLRLEIFGRTWWSGDSLVERSREVRIRLRRRLDLFQG